MLGATCDGSVPGENAGPKIPYQCVQCLSKVLHDLSCRRSGVQSSSGARSDQEGRTHLHLGSYPPKTVKPGTATIEDKVPVEHWVDVRADLIRRLQADTCELCGSQENCEVHHVRKLVDLKRRWAGRREKPTWVQKMATLRRKTLIVCRKCHHAIHNGTFDLPKA